MARTATTQLITGLPPVPPALHTPGGQTLRVAMRKLWSDHVIWTRDYVVNAVGDAPATKVSAERLLRNQEDIGNAVATYYGKSAGNQLTKLLKEHITIAVELVEAVKDEDQRKLKDADQRWTDNANDIARFLGKANKFWPEDQVADLLSLHLELTKKEADARARKDWPDDIKAFDDIFSEIVTLADALAAGIVQQFPERFKE